MRAEGNDGGPLRLIVSGGIGSGKSTVTRMLREHGAVVIEADRIGHAVLEPDGAAFAAVASQWPMAVVEGHINRGLLAAIVFTDEAQLALLESMTHPHIRDEIERRVAQNAARHVVVELPLAAEFFPGGWTRVVVVAPESLRLQRTVARGMPAEDVQNRMAVQPGLDEWMARADVVIENDGSLDDLRASVAAVWRQLTAS